MQKPRLEIEYLLGPRSNRGFFPTLKKLLRAGKLAINRDRPERVASIGLRMFFGLTPTTIAIGLRD